MIVNQECVRYALLYLEGNLDTKDNGRAIEITAQELYLKMNNYDEKDVYIAVRYLSEKGLIRVGNADKTSPRKQHIYEITAIGTDYIAAIKDDKIWSKLKGKLGNIAQSSIPIILESAASLIVKSF